MHSSIYLHRYMIRCIHTYPYILCVELPTHAFISFSSSCSRSRSRSCSRPPSCSFTFSRPRSVGFRSLALSRSCFLTLLLSRSISFSLSCSLALALTFHVHTHTHSSRTSCLFRRLSSPFSFSLSDSVSSRLTLFWNHQVSCLHSSSCVLLYLCVYTRARVCDCLHQPVRGQDQVHYIRINMSVHSTARISQSYNCRDCRVAWMFGTWGERKIKREGKRVRGERARERERGGESERERERESAKERARERESEKERARERVCVCVRERERETE